MARDGLYPLLCAGVLCAAAPPLAAQSPTQARIKAALQVQVALEQGGEHLQRGEYRAAVEVLERSVHLVDGQHRYLEALREAYTGYIRELKKDNKLDQVAVYQERLDVIARADRLAGPAPRATPATPPATGAVTPVAASSQPAVAPMPVATYPAPAAPSPPAVPAVVAVPPVKTAPGPTEVARGKIDTTPAVDPFSDENSVEYRQAKQKLDRAYLEFGAGHYAEAGRLFAEADRLCHAAAAPAREQWAYCILDGVNEALPRATKNDAAGLERDVRTALAMAPKLDRVGNDLLRQIQAKQGAADPAAEAKPAVTVRHIPRQQGQSYAVAETANFRVYHNQKSEYAERVARIAEETKAAASRKWFGDDGGTWSPRCEIYLHATGADYSQATRVPASSPGHSTIERDRDSAHIRSRRIDLHVDDPRILGNVLPHETTHTVLAGRLGARDVPRWADEGMAVLSEPRAKIDSYLANLPRQNRERRLFPCGELMRLPNYPDAAFVDVFYSQSVSLVEFLSSRKGPQVFARFVREGAEGGYEAALKKHYDIPDFHELDRQWRGYALAEGTGTAVTAGKR